MADQPIDRETPLAVEFNQSLEKQIRIGFTLHDAAECFSIRHHVDDIKLQLVFLDRNADGSADAARC